MQCSKCGAEVSVLREFCPQCGTSTAAGMRERGFGPPDGRPVEELQRNRGRVLMVGAGILIVLGVMGKFSWPGIPIHIGTHTNSRGRRSPSGRSSSTTPIRAIPPAPTVASAAARWSSAARSYGQCPTVTEASTCG